MTYSESVKEELCEAKFSCEGCNAAFISAMLLCRNTENPAALFVSSSRDIVDLLAQKIVEDTGVIATTTGDMDIKSGHTKHDSFKLSIDESEDIAEFYKRFSKALMFEVDTSKVTKSCCKSAFMRGLFLGCGVLVNPQKEYHFEFKLHNKKLADELFDLVQSTGISFKRTTRKGHEIIYLKDSEAIEEILTLMGAYKNALDLMNIKIVKEVRNKANRARNCDTANINKTVTASMRQTQDIKFIIAEKGENYLPDDLKDVARLRLDNPDLSLSDLCGIMPDGISRSGLNHRLSRLTKLAQEIRELPSHSD